MKDIVIIGAGGLAREVADICIAAGHELVGHVVDPSYGTAGQPSIHGCRVIGDLSWFLGQQDRVRAVCAFGSPQTRLHLTRRAEAIGVKFCVVLAPSARISPSATIRAGSIICPNVVVGPNVVIGSHVVVNMACTLGHDVFLEDYATLSPGVHVSGGTCFEVGAFAGTGATFIEGLTIGHWSTIGAGTTVLRDVVDNTTVMGVPGRLTATLEQGWFMKGGDHAVD